MSFVNTIKYFCLANSLISEGKTFFAFETLILIRIEITTVILVGECVSYTSNTRTELIFAFHTTTNRHLISQWKFIIRNSTIFFTIRNSNFGNTIDLVVRSI